MGGLRRAFWRLINAIHPDREEANLKREVASHLRLLEDQYRRRGLSADDARRSARLAFGGIDHAKELHRDARAFRWLDDARRDAAYAVRMLRRHPVATAAAVLSLALGVGLNAAVFSVVDWVLVRPLPYPAPHELVRVFTAGMVGSPGPSALSHALIHDEFVTFGDATAFRASAAFTTATRVMASCRHRSGTCGRRPCQRRSLRHTRRESGGRSGIQRRGTRRGSAGRRPGTPSVAARVRTRSGHCRTHDQTAANAPEDRPGFL